MRRPQITRPVRETCIIDSLYLNFFSSEFCRYSLLSGIRREFGYLRIIVAINASNSDSFTRSKLPLVPGGMLDCGRSNEL
jgi:hypothetical protein